jgi:hypothetical protein
MKSKLPAHWYLIGRSMSAPLLLLSPSNILPPFRFHFRMEEFGALLKMSLFQFFKTFFETA